MRYLEEVIWLTCNNSAVYTHTLPPIYVPIQILNRSKVSARNYTRLPVAIAILPEMQGPCEAVPNQVGSALRNSAAEKAQSVAADLANSNGLIPDPSAIRPLRVILFA